MRSLPERRCHFRRNRSTAVGSRSSIVALRQISADFEAWIHGPVLPSLYEEFKQYGARPIDRMATSEEGEAYLQKFLMNYGAEFSSFMQDVTEEYFPRAAYELEALTHQEQPWIEARNGAAPDEPSRAIIRKETMKKYYRQFIP